MADDVTNNRGRFRRVRLGFLLSTSPLIRQMLDAPWHVHFSYCQECILQYCPLGRRVTGASHGLPKRVFDRHQARHAYRCG
jgi:hypothetical protein